MLEHVQRVWEGAQGAYPVTSAFLGLTETLLIAGVNEACVKVFSLLLALKFADQTLCCLKCVVAKQLPEISCSKAIASFCHCLTCLLWAIQAMR